MEYSEYGQKFSEPSGIFQLMDDLDRALSGPERDQVKMLGGGNPALIDGVIEYLRRRMLELVNRPDAFTRMLGIYDHPEGNLPFREELAAFFAKRTGLKITHKNIALTQGSQSAFFQLFNLFSGQHNNPERKVKKVLFPMLPEYIGYESLGIVKDQLTGLPPVVEETGPGVFRYKIDMHRVEESLKYNEIALICLSRPANPTGAVCTVDELKQLQELAVRYGVRLIVDGAYGRPFPGMVYSDDPQYDFYHDEGMISVLSLSKAGLPGVRTGIIIADESIVTMIGRMNAVMQLASPTIGPAMMKGSIEDGSFTDICNRFVLPFYAKRRQLALEILDDATDRQSVGLKRHESLGAFFLWLTFEGTKEKSESNVIYKKLAEKNVIVVPGHHYFPGAGLWQYSHSNSSVRISYLSSPEDIEAGLTAMIELAKGN